MTRPAPRHLVANPLQNAAPLSFGALTFAAVVILCAPMAMAQGLSERLLQLDLDKDGQLSKAEFMTTPADRFAAADIDSDGMLSVDEMVAGFAPASVDPERAAKQMARMITRRDQDGDGKLALAEVPGSGATRSERQFSRIDSDGDGFLTVDEIDLAAATLKQRADGTDQ